MDQFRMLLAIPAYRCAEQIPRVLSALVANRGRLAAIEKVIVVDNQSPDSTVEVAQRTLTAQGRDAWIQVVRNHRNFGLGGSHKVIFNWAREQGFTHVLILHGDDQADVPDIPKIISTLQAGWDAALGSRFMKGSSRVGYSTLRTVGNRALNILYSILTLRRVKDLGSGLNGFKLAALNPGTYGLFANHFTFNMDLLLDLLARDRKIKFVPITWREVDQSSNARTFAVGWQALITLLRWRFGWRSKGDHLDETAGFAPLDS